MSGVGRGRGWLKLNGPNQPGVPWVGNFDLIHRDQIFSEEFIDEDDELQVCSNSSTDGHEICAELTSRLQEFSSEDGIKSNKTLREVMDYFGKNCRTADEFKTTCRSLYNSCLRRSELIPSYIILMSTPWAKQTEMHGTTLRYEFFVNFKNDFERCHELQKSDPLVFRNYVHMIGQFLYVMKKSGVTMRPIALALLEGLEMLLVSAGSLDLKTLNEQLYMNATQLKLTPTSPLMITVRKMLLNEDNMSLQNRTRLLMSSDIVHGKGNSLPADVFQLYKDQLGEEEIADLQNCVDKLKEKDSSSPRTKGLNPLAEVFIPRLRPRA